MKTITLRNLPLEVVRIVQKRAHNKGISLNRAVIDLVRESLGLNAERKRPREHNDLDHLSGVWGKEEASIFEKTLEHQRPLDSEIWK